MPAQRLEGKHRRHGRSRRALVLGSALAGLFAGPRLRRRAPTHRNRRHRAPTSSSRASIRHAAVHTGDPDAATAEAFGESRVRRGQGAGRPRRPRDRLLFARLSGRRQSAADDGRDWEVMRLSRNRNWGTPELVAFIEHFAEDARRFEGWPGLLVGDMSPTARRPDADRPRQPSGRPRCRSLVLAECRAKVLSRQERENTSAHLARHRTTSARSIPPPGATITNMLLKRAASFGEVERIFVHPAIKQKLCQLSAKDLDRSWLAKIRPFWGHNDHFHVRIKCPEGMASCKTQAPVTGDIGCGKQVANWRRAGGPPAETPTRNRSRHGLGITVDALPHDCHEVLAAPPPPKRTAEADTISHEQTRIRDRRSQ